jgi:hypothetical protein
VQINAALAAIPVGPPNLSISATQIAAGSTATLTWASYGTTGCTASGSWSGAQAPSGTLAITPAAAGTLTYSLACTGASGTGPSATVTLSVQSAAGHHGGGALDLVTLILLGMVLLPRAIWTWRPARADTNA